MEICQIIARWTRAENGRVFVQVIALAMLAQLGCQRHDDTSSGNAPPPRRAELIEQQVAELRTKADRGDPEAQCALGNLLMDGRALKRDYTQAADWYRKAAQQDNAEAQNNLGMLHQAGRGVPHDDAIAADWFQKAANQGHAGAAFNLASLNAAGRGVPQNSTNAARLYLKAAESGDAVAQYNVGQRYELGRGVAADLIEAFKWHELAARQGLPDAATARDNLRARMNTAEIAEAQRRVAAFRIPGTNAPASK